MLWIGYIRRQGTSDISQRCSCVLCIYMRPNQRHFDESNNRDPRDFVPLRTHTKTHT